MSGHSKWANTKHRKTAKDGKKSKIFTRIIRNLTSESRLSGGKSDGNPRLRFLMELASQNNISKKVIARAVSHGSRNPPHRITCGGFGPGSSAMLIECLDKDSGRVTQRVTDVFCRFGGRLCGCDAVSHLFEKKGHLIFRPPKCHEDDLLGKIVEIGGEDLIFHSEDEIEVYVKYNDLSRARCALLESGLDLKFFGSVMMPLFRTELSAEEGVAFACLLKELDHLEDVEVVCHNAMIR